MEAVILELVVVVGAFSDVEGAVEFCDDVRLVLGEVHFLTSGLQLTIVLPYSYCPCILRLASIAELMSLNIMKACPRIRMLRLAMIYLKEQQRRLFLRTLQRW